MAKHTADKYPNWHMVTFLDGGTTMLIEEEQQEQQEKRKVVNIFYKHKALGHKEENHGKWYHAGTNMFDNKDTYIGIDEYEVQPTTSLMLDSIATYIHEQRRQPYLTSHKKR